MTRSTNGTGTLTKAGGRAGHLGRGAQGERTRQRIADALISLLQDGQPAPTASQVAQRARVSERLVFYHFNDMESLYTMAMAVQTERHRAALCPVDPALALDERVDRTVRQRARFFDAISYIRRAAVALTPVFESIATYLADSDKALRDSLEVTFTCELEAAGQRRPSLLDVLDAAASSEAWERLRRNQALSVANARQAMAMTLTALLT